MVKTVNGSVAGDLVPGEKSGGWGAKAYGRECEAVAIAARCTRRTSIPRSYPPTAYCESASGLYAQIEGVLHRSRS